MKHFPVVFLRPLSRLNIRPGTVLWGGGFCRSYGEKSILTIVLKAIKGGDEKLQEVIFGIDTFYRNLPFPLGSGGECLGISFLFFTQVVDGPDWEHL